MGRDNHSDRWIYCARLRRKLRYMNVYVHCTAHCAVCTMCSYEDPAFLSTILADQAPKPAIPCSTILLVNFQHLICWNERMKLMFRSPLSRFLLGLVGKGPLISSGSMKSNLSPLILHRMIYLVDCSAVSKAKSISYVDVAFTTENNGNAIGKTNKSD